MAYTKDQRIINENPTLTAYQLLTEKGLSQEKYDELVKDNYQPKITPESGVIKTSDELIAEYNSAKQAEKITPPEPIQPTVKKWNELKQEPPQKTVKWSAQKATASVRPMPKTNDYVSPYKGPSEDLAWLINKKTGGQTRMSKNHAMRMKRKYPNEYDVR